VAKLRVIASFLPETILSNDELAEFYPGWTAQKIEAKTGITERHIAAPGETAADLAYAAATRLFQHHNIDPAQIDMLLLCTQTPDHVIPTTACALHHRLGLRRTSGAIDIGLACSGFVYGLALAKGLIESGLAASILLVTADTYSKLIHPLDRSVRTLFGDGAAATLIEAVEAEVPAIGPFVFGTDGAGTDKLLVPAGAMRRPACAASAIMAADPSGNVRSADNLFMDGAAIMAFSLAEVPKAVALLTEASGIALADMDAVVFHQASALLLEALRKKLGIPREKFILAMARSGNTVSSTIPIALEHLMATRATTASAMLVGFGAGYSWAATNVTLN